MVGLAEERLRPSADEAPVLAEDLPGPGGSRRLHRGDELVQLLVGPEVAESLREKEVAAEEPTPLALEQADVVHAVAGRVEHVEAQRSLLHHVPQRLGAEAGGAAPDEPPVALLLEAVLEEGNPFPVHAWHEAARGAQKGGRPHVVLVVMGEDEGVDAPAFERLHELAGGRGRPAVQEEAVHQVGAGPVEGPAEHGPGQADMDDLAVALRDDHVFSGGAPGRRSSPSRATVTSRTPTPNRTFR